MNADEENYTKGVRLEVDFLEISILTKALEMAIELDDNPICDMHQELLEKLSKIKICVDKNMFTTEL
ncbi:hypothetical protein [Tenacibaculum finnmarkense]|nr:hypothetical protein [Tenacibaculum finnmarkense]MCG8239770.1 hypothetical protein [Tenacibaculum finnmarkense genomovar ulcerans]